jgi:hypothetical protein
MWRRKLNRRKCGNLAENGGSLEMTSAERSEEKLCAQWRESAWRNGSLQSSENVGNGIGVIIGENK